MGAVSARELHVLSSFALALTAHLVVGCSGSGIGPDSFAPVETGGGAVDSTGSGDPGTAGRAGAGGAAAGVTTAGASGAGGADADAGGGSGSAGRAGASGSSGFDGGNDGGTRPRDAGSTDAITGTCPTSITLNGQNSTRRYGGSDGNLYTDVCPSNQVIIGFLGAVDTRSPASIGRLQAVCGALSIGTSAGAGCDVRMSRASTLPERGAFGASSFTQMCPADQAVVGFQGSSGTLLNQIAFVCAPLVVSRTDAGYAISLGPTHVLSANGGGGGRTFKDGCAAGQVARGDNIVVSNNGARAIVQSFGLICGTPVGR